LEPEALRLKIDRVKAEIFALRSSGYRDLNEAARIARETVEAIERGEPVPIRTSVLNVRVGKAAMPAKAPTRSDTSIQSHTLAAQRQAEREARLQAKLERQADREAKLQARDKRLAERSERLKRAGKAPA